MEYPNFYDKIESFVLYDALSNFLGATKHGIVEISYLDCVKLASHSCPTVAGSYILTKVALDRLYGDDIPKRGNIRVELKESRESGVVGVIGAVAGYICGASDSGGFVGIGDKFNKRDLLTFGNSEIGGLIKFTRVDIDSCVTLDLDTSKIPAMPHMKELMQKNLQGIATVGEQNEFKKLWQSRVEYMLINQDRWNEFVIEI